MKLSFIRAAVAASTAVLLFAAVFVAGSSALASHENASVKFDQCPSGKMSVRLTGWSLNGKTPRGEATFEEASKTWNVKVSSLGLEDGTALAVYLEDEKLVETTEVKGGELVAAFSVSSLPDNEDLFSVNMDDRPVVTGSIKCTEPANTNAK